ncbi:MAG: hypothetical protein CMF75_02875 [Maricaulis sp.]|nr:hypothetical protein [Maricaulis sp.]
MSKSKRNAHFFKTFTSVAKGKVTLDGENLEDATYFIHSYGKNAKSYSLMWKILLAITIGVVVLLMIKLGNTSEMALRYNEQAQAEFGQWVLAVIGLSFLSLMFFFMGLLMGNRAKAWRALLVSELRKRADGDTPHKSLYESLLRELGA